MDSVDSISLWLDRLKDGDQLAAQRLWERYYHRLIGLARKKLGDSPRQVKDEDDVVQSDFTSFCIRAQAGQFPNLSDRNSLWPLLVMITARKASNQRAHERCVKRGSGTVRNAGGSEASDGAATEFAQAISNEPSPDDVAVFLIELNRIMDSLVDPSHRVILLWKLEERSNPEIARHLDCSLSSVERMLRLIRRSLDEENRDGT